MTANATLDSESSDFVEDADPKLQSKVIVEVSSAADVAESGRGKSAVHPRVQEAEGGGAWSSKEKSGRALARTTYAAPAASADREDATIASHMLLLLLLLLSGGVHSSANDVAMVTMPLVVVAVMSTATTDGTK